MVVTLMINELNIESAITLMSKGVFENTKHVPESLSSQLNLLILAMTDYPCTRVKLILTP